jgi:predicted HTH transcriptional regulator
MQEAEIEELLNESEGTALDFKRDQYPLTNDLEKSELIKDVLAFTNSWRRTDAFILIGVEESKGGGRSNPVGITKHLKDSDLQQLVNSKTNRPITFSYAAVKFQTVWLGVIKIPVQERPVFLTNGFGKLKADIVYVRRSSSTAEACEMMYGPVVF